MLINRNAIKWIIGLEVGVFAMVILIVWANEIFDLPYKLFSSPPAPTRLSEALLISSLILFLGIATVIITSLLARIKKLESFIYICSWCKKLKVDDSWIAFEEYLEKYRGTRSSHGICPICSDQVRRQEGLTK